MIEKLLVGIVCSFTALGILLPQTVKWDNVRIVLWGTAVVLGIITLILGEKGFI